MGLDTGKESTVLVHSTHVGDAMIYDQVTTMFLCDFCEI